MRRRALVPVTVVILATACGATYVPPNLAINESHYSVTIDRPFSEVWANLIDHVSRSSFALKQVERASGLVTLDFGANAEVDKLVDCGRAIWRRSGRDESMMTFYRGKGYPIELTGWMNVFLRASGANQTFVRVTARYTLRVGNLGWTFDTGQSATDGDRACRPSYLAERTILEGAAGSVVSP